MIIPATDINSALLAVGGKIFKAQAAGNLDGPWVDRTGFDSVSATGLLGTAAGAPTSETLTLQIWHATSSGGAGAAELEPDGVTPAQSVTGISAATASADNTIAQLGTRLMNCNQFIKVRAVLGFVGGTSPTQDVAVMLNLSGENQVPTTPPNP